MTTNVDPVYKSDGVQRTNHLPPDWSDQASLLFHLLLPVWISKLLRTPVFVLWAPHVRCHLLSHLELSGLTRMPKSEKMRCCWSPDLWPLTFPCICSAYDSDLNLLSPFESLRLKKQTGPDPEVFFFQPHVPCVRTVRQWGVISPLSELYSTFFFHLISTKMPINFWSYGFQFFFFFPQDIFYSVRINLEPWVLLHVKDLSRAPSSVLWQTRHLASFISLTWVFKRAAGTAEGCKAASIWRGRSVRV